MTGEPHSLESERGGDAVREVEGMQELFALSEDLMCVAGPDGYLKIVNPAFSRVLGYSREELLARPYLDFLHPDDVVRTLAEVANLEQGGDVSDFENRYRCADGDHVWLQWRSRTGSDGRTYAVAREVTEQRRTHALLQETQRTADVGGWELDFTTDELYWTEQTYRLHEVDPDSFVPTLEAAVAFYAPESLPLISAAVEEGKRTGRPWDLELKIITAKGRIRDVRAAGAVDWVDGEVVRAYGSFQDITERKRLEEQLLHSQKLEGIGRLAGGVAHDFNNLLTAIVGNVELLRRRSSLDEGSRVHLAAVERAAEQACQVTGQLLAFARKQAREPVLLDLGQRVVELMGVLGRLLGEGVELRTRIEGSGRLVLIDPGHFETVLINLAVNASDAIGESGELRIEVSDVDGPLTDPVELPAGEYVQLLVCDDGEGIAPDLLPFIFEPFFTTKEQGKGTGLGLATCFGIVEQNGGQIDVTSEQGVGTQLRLVFPSTAGVATEREASEGDPGQACDADPPRGRTLLLIEDEEPVREVTRAILEHAGHRVIAAVDGHEALRIAPARAGEIDGIITDLGLPGMSGSEALRRLRELLGPVPALLVSGYPGNRSGSDEAAPLLQKPFTARALEDRVRRMFRNAAD